MTTIEIEETGNSKAKLAVAGSNAAIRPVDQLVLELLRNEPGLTVTDLTTRLEVTATAVRQRLDRLEEMELVDREKCSTSRGRPVFQYRLSSLGWRRVGFDYVEFATAMWDVVQKFPDPQVRRQLLDSVSQRMGQKYGELLPNGSLAERIFAMVNVLNERKVPTKVSNVDSLPVIEVQSCPFPDLLDEDGGRSICELETQMLSEAIGQPLQLSSCRLDGHQCCQYRSASPAESVG